LNIYIINTITTIESIPPQRLKRAATKPLVRNTKKDFKTAIVNASFLLRKNNAYITAILESPNLTPGTETIIGGSVFSMKAKTKAVAKRREVKTNRLVLL
jgi:hypothetical protein